MHLPLLLKGINKETPYDTIGERQLQSLIKCIFNINRTNAKATADMFYKNKLPKTKNKSGFINHYMVANHISEEDIAKVIGVDAGNITLKKLLSK